MEKSGNSLQSSNLNTVDRNITSTLAQFCMMVQEGSPLSLNPGKKNKCWLGRALGNKVFIKQVLHWR